MTTAQTELPFYDSAEDALRSCVQALGGAKQVGSMLWPDKSPDQAARLLLDTLNASRPEKLELTQIMRVLRLARDAGHHAAMQWMAQEIGYEAKPITKAEEVARLTAVVEQSSKTLATAIAALERMQRVRSAA